MHLPKINEKVCPHKDLHMNVYSNYIHNINTGNNPHILQQTSKQIVVSLYNRILLKNKKEQTNDTCNHMDESQKHYLNKTCQTKKEFYCVSPFLEIPERAKVIHSDRKQISCFLGPSEERHKSKEWRENFCGWLNCSVSWLWWWLLKCTHLSYNCTLEMGMCNVM